MKNYIYMLALHSIIHYQRNIKISSNHFPPWIFYALGGLQNRAVPQ